MPMLGPSGVTSNGLSFSILGPLEATKDGERLDLGSRRQRALLVRLLLAGGRVVSSDQLVEDLWGGNPPASAAATLQSYVSRLRRALGDDRRVLVSEAGGYALRAGREQLDVARFQELAERGSAALREARFDEADVLLSKALSLWRGEPLADFTYDGFADADIKRLRSERLAVVEDRAEAALALGCHAALVPTLEQLVGENPLRERLRAQLVLALYRCDRQAEALDVLRDTRRVLTEELGIDPSPRLRELEAQILNQDPALEWTPPPSAAVNAGSSDDVEISIRTFLLTDIEGSTKLLRRLGEHVYGDVLAAQRSILEESVTAHGGQAVDSWGDSFFGAFPRPADCVLAAVEAQRRIRDHDWPANAECKVRMGINTGEASLDGRTYVGMAVHRTARICDAGHGGQILLSESTKEVLDDGEVSFTVRDLGERRLKDLDHPVRLYQVVAEGLNTDFPPLRAAAATEEMPAGRPAGAVRLVGRDDEMGMLTEALKAAAGGTGRIVLLEGEPGIGKSRLTLELAQEAGVMGMQLLWGGCYEGGGAPAFWPWTQVLRALVRHLTDDERGVAADQLASLLPELANGAPASPPAAPEADERFRLYQAVVSLLAGVAARQPLMLVIDDLHWADPASLQLLQALSLQTVSLPLLVVSTFRDDEPGAADTLAGPLGVISRHPWTRRLALRGLSYDAVREVIRETAEIEPPPQLVSAIRARTEGNPFFVAELVRLLESEGGLEEGRTLYTGIPLGVRDVVRRRLLSLPEASQDILRLAAVIGRDVDFRVLARASEKDAATCAELLEPPLASRLVMPAEEPGVYRFSHALVRETIADDLTPLRRARLNLSVADALREVYGEDEDHAEPIAEHSWRAREFVEPKRALGDLERAFNVAMSRYGYESAEELLVRQLELARALRDARARDERQLSLELQLGSLRMLTRGYGAPEVIAGFRRATDLGRRLGHVSEIVLALHGLAAGLLVAAQYRECLSVARECRSVAEESGGLTDQSFGYFSTGICELYNGLFADSRASLHRAVELWKASGREINPNIPASAATPPPLLAPIFLILTELYCGNVERSHALRDQVVAGALASEEPQTIQFSLYVAASAAQLEHDLARVREYSELILEWGASSPSRLFVTVAPSWLAWVDALEGKGERHVERIDESIAAQIETGARSRIAEVWGLKADVWAHWGNLEEAVRCVDKGLELFAERGGYVGGELLLKRGRLLADMGDAAQARAAFERAFSIAEDGGALWTRDRARAALDALDS